MDLDILKNFVRMDVEVLVGGVWIRGNLSPIVKGVIVLSPLADEKDFFGIASLKAESIQAIRQVKQIGNIPSEQVQLPKISVPVDVKSSFEAASTPRYIIDKGIR